MALKKKISEQEHFYAYVSQVEYKKNNAVVIHVFLEQRKTGTDELIHRDVSTYVPLKDQQAPFALDAMCVEGENIIKASYIFLKTFKPLYFDFEDC